MRVYAPHDSTVRYLNNGRPLLLGDFNELSKEELATNQDLFESGHLLLVEKKKEGE